MSDIQVGDTREHTLQDGTVITQKLWEAADGLGPHCWCPVNSCVFCDHCTDIYYDYSNGPYMFVCELDEGKGMDDDSHTGKGAIGECEWFVEGEDE
jgi:hypothetical protein